MLLTAFWGEKATGKQNAKSPVAASTKGGDEPSQVNSKKQRSIQDFFKQGKDKQAAEENATDKKRPIGQVSGTTTSESSSDKPSTELPPRPKTPTSTKREPDTEPPATPMPLSRRLMSSSSFDADAASLDCRYMTPSTSDRMYSQDEMDFLTPQDQPVVHLSNPTTPSPLRKKPRRLENNDFMAMNSQELVDDMDEISMKRQSSVDLPDREDDVGSMLSQSQSQHFSQTFLHRGEKKPRPSEEEEGVNPFAPIAPTLGRKRPSRKRRSLPSTFGRQMAVSKYLADFTELELLGSGQFSKVYKVLKKFDGWIYAVKKSRHHLRRKTDLEMAMREVQALAALKSSHVVRYFDAWIEDELLYIQLEYCSSLSLEKMVEKHGANGVPESVLCKLLRHLAKALSDMHAAKIAHMDVKIDNVLLAPGDIYKLGDLGTAAHVDGSMEITEGDNRYLSRELMEGSRLNLRAGDIFALGATIYELAMGKRLPSNGDEWQQIRNGELVMFRQYSNSLQHLISSMMHPDPLQRPLADEILQHEAILR